MATTRGDHPTISGHLGTIDVQDVMGFLGTLPGGGALEIDSPDGEMILYLDGGAIVGGLVVRGGVDAAALLLGRGRLSRQDLDVVRDALQGADLYSALVDAGRFGSEEAAGLAGEELSVNLVRLFAWAPGEFRFYEGRRPPPEVAPVRIDIRNLLLESARRCESWDVLPGIYAEPETRFALRTEPHREATVALDLDEWKVLFLVANRWRLGEIWEKSSLGSRFETSRTLFGLASARLIQPIGASVHELGSAAPAPARKPPPAPVLADRPAPTVELRMPAKEDPEADTLPVVTGEANRAWEAEAAAPRAQPRRRLTRSEIRIARRPILVQLVAEGEPRVFELAGEKTSLGRAPDNNLILPDGHVSGHHARLVRDGDRFDIEDTRSSNGIRVDGRAVSRTRLEGGEEIEIYPYRFRFELAFDISEAE